MEIRDPDYLQELWYVASASNAIKRGQAKHLTLLGKAILMGRKNNHKVFAVSDVCPHRGTLLSRGKFNGEYITCKYHGWEFKTDGQCTKIPSQLRCQKPKPSAINIKEYHVHEENGIIWIYMGNNKPDENTYSSLTHPKCKLQVHIVKTFECDIDLAITGLMDPAHGAFIHTSSLWRKYGQTEKKSKRFVPLPLGWRMESHTASLNSRAYRFFMGGAPKTQIDYVLPGIRFEHAWTPRVNYQGLTSCTPIDKNRTAVNHFMYWDLPGGVPLRGIIKLFGNRFLEQDAQAVLDMKDGQAFGPESILVEGADTQIRWYFKLKKEWLQSRKEERPFINRIKPTTLEWNS